MDLQRRLLEWTDLDFTKFSYGKRETTVLTKLANHKIAKVENLTTKGDWDNWFRNASFLYHEDRIPGTCVVICSRANPVFEEIPAPAHYLPFERDVFKKIVQKFCVHPAITRTIGREVTSFTCYEHRASDPDDLKMLCTARTSSLFPGDLAVSSVFLAKSELTLAVIYGCSERQKQEIIRRLENVDLSYNHPLLPSGLVVELERIRLADRVDDLLDRFVLKASSSQELDLDMDKKRMAAFLKLCYESRDLINQIHAEKRQLTAISKRTTFLKSRKHLQAAGRQIRARLSEICSEYDDKLGECNMVIENTSLTMQTSMNHFARVDNSVNLHLSKINTQLARTSTDLTQDMRRDSSQMRSIALLTMVFLPLSTVATVFSTTFFDWNATADKTVVSGYIWIFVVIAVGLTSTTVGAWYFATRRVRNEGAASETSRTLDALFHESV
ncbi:uncharacterized protein BDR25DRAFT_306502 [Lindgomyces ingoldianus]|uniref:Uncharacterized protein n=1 Tax=Lindgomyces ingoldianus TaxID=673940 RepID=A0ACB6QH79_9PLEO|nr:uncharacterized protein BDR25DRAFT_306502 [Lindgomyces ingoldianus]KAF2465717.1 hypothetical protein BDR25DRAFT_306502 [Lindgomyces ingoldianus]